MMQVNNGWIGMLFDTCLTICSKAITRTASVLILPITMISAEVQSESFQLQEDWFGLLGDITHSNYGADTCSRGRGVAKLICVLSLKPYVTDSSAQLT